MSHRVVDFMTSIRSRSRSGGNSNRTETILAAAETAISRASVSGICTVLHAGRSAGACLEPADAVADDGDLEREWCR